MLVRLTFEDVEGGQVKQKPKARRKFDQVKSEHLATNLDTPDLVIPLIAEELDIHKQLVDKARVRLTKVVHQRPTTIRELLTSEHIEVERVPRDEIMATPPSVRFEGDVTIIPVIEEVLVVTKHFRLKEELRITKKHSVNEHRQEITLRSEELTVQRFTKSETNPTTSKHKEK